MIMRSAFCAAGFLFLAATLGWAQSLQSIVVEAGKFDRVGSVVECSVPQSAFCGQRDVVLTTGDGSVCIPGQIGPPKLGACCLDECRVLTFVLPCATPLNAGRCCEFVVSACRYSGDVFNWNDQPNSHRDLAMGNRQVLSYVYEPVDRTTPARFDETFKVYHHWFDPQGTALVTKGGGGLYPHHRGISYAFNRIAYGDQQADLWHCRDGECESHHAFAGEVAGPVYGRHQVLIDWRGRDGAIFARELRELTAYNAAGGNLLEFRSRLTTELPLVHLDGDPQHAGFQFRATQQVADVTKEQTYYLRPDGKDNPGKFRNWSAEPNETADNLGHVDLPWNAMSFVVDGRRFTCCYLDHPSNPKPARFSERDYGRFGSYFAFDLTPDRPLEIRYRLWLQDGEMTVGEADLLGRDFAEPCRATAICR